MEIHNLEPVLRQHPLFQGIAPRYVELLTGCASNVVFNAGDLICRAGTEANHFFIIRSGKVAVEVHPPQLEPMTIQTLEDGDVLGWSWLFPPYRWNFDSRAVALTRAVALDAKCLRGKCDEDHHLGYDLMTRFSAIMVERLNATRLQLIDVYGSPEKPPKSLP
jgi:CRP-like cAMP-binding protein